MYYYDNINAGTGVEIISPILQNGCIFEETDTNKFYQYNSATGLWTYITP